MVCPLDDGAGEGLDLAFSEDVGGFLGGDDVFEVGNLGDVFGSDVDCGILTDINGLRRRGGGDGRRGGI